MKLLKLFSGTSSVGMDARDLGYSVISLDLKCVGVVNQCHLSQGNIFLTRGKKGWFMVEQTTLHSP